MWYLKPNVYLVDGKINAAIYDLNNGELYHINTEAKELLHRVFNRENSTISSEDNIFLKELFRLNILTTKYSEISDILELYEKPNIDFVWIEVTNICNLKCIHCYNETSCNVTQIMKLSDFYHIIDELVLNGISKLQIIGGEPFILGERLFNYLVYCIGKFEYIEIFTNGTLVKENWLKYFKKNNIKIALSVYSYIESMHNKVTKDNLSWKMTNSTITKLHSYAIEYKVKNVLMKDVMIGERNTDLYKLSNRKDIVRLTGRAQLDLLSDDLLKKKLITEKNLVAKLSYSLVKKCVSGHNCFSRRLYFSSDLTVYPCVMERRINHGNIKDNSLAAIIDDEIFQINKDCIEECKECEFRYCCFDCRPDSNGNNLLNKPWYCSYMPMTGEWDKTDEFVQRIKNQKVGDNIS